MPGSSHLMPRDPMAFSGFCSGDFREEMSLKPLSAISLFGNACLEESSCLTFLSAAVVSSIAMSSPLQIYISTEQKPREERHQVLETVSVPEMSVPKDVLCLDHSSCPRLQHVFRKTNTFKGTESSGRWEWTSQG